MSHSSLPARVRPEDFYNGTPGRIMGTEIEYAVHGGPDDRADYLAADNLDRAGITYVRMAAPPVRLWWLENGGRIHREQVELLEYGSPEVIGPQAAVEADGAGDILMERIFKAYGPGAGQVLRQAGVVDMMNQNGHQRDVTMGEHTNFGVPSHAAIPLTDRLMSSHLATRSWGWAGKVGLTSFVLSQKASGIAHPFGQHGSSLSHGNKSMGSIRGDTDIVAGAWRRAEVRFSESGFLEVPRLLNFATTSLVLRISELRRIFKPADLAAVQLADPVGAMYLTSADLTLQETHLSCTGKEVTAIDIQEMYALLAARIGEEFELPPGEKDTPGRWIDMCDKMRQASPEKGDLASIERDVDWAMRLKYLLREDSLPDIRADNNRANARSIHWSRVYPLGPGRMMGQKLNSEGTIQGAKHLAHNPPSDTRAALRGSMIANPNVVLDKVEWAGIKGIRHRPAVPGRFDYSLDPYQTNLSSLG